MNWSKAKTYMIVGFAVINIFLAVRYFNIGNANRDSDGKTFREQVENELRRKNIGILTQIPDETNFMPLLEVEYDTYNKDSGIIPLLLGDDFEEIAESEVYLNADNQSVKIYGNKKVVFSLRESEKDSKITGETAKKNAQDYMKLKGFETDLWHLDYFLEEEDGVKVVFKQKYGKFTLENSYIILYADSSGVYSGEIQTIKKVSANEGNISVTPAASSLLRLLGDDDIYNDNITDMHLCYYKEEDPDRILVKDNLIPSWKIMFESGKIKYLEEKD